MENQYQRHEGEKRKRREGTAPEVKAPDIRVVPIDLIKIDSTYQRDLEVARVRRLVGNWNPQLVGVLILSARGGSLWCVDGQHRLAAMREMGIEHVEAKVLDGLAQTQEAGLFVDYNNARKTLSVWDAFKAEVVAQVPDALEIVRIVNSAGFLLAQAAGPRHIQALQAVRRLYRLGGEDLLRLTLQTIRSMWSSDRLALSARVMGGLGLFYYGFFAEPIFKHERLVGILEVTPPVAFLRAAQQIQYERMATGASAFAVAEALRVRYNEGLSKANRLGPIKTIAGRRFSLTLRGRGDNAVPPRPAS